MAEAVIAGKTPIAVDVEGGKTYWWCTCGRSQKQPFCDGTHKGSEFAPPKYDAAVIVALALSEIESLTSLFELSRIDQ